MEKRIICIDSKGLYLKKFIIDYDFNADIQITNQKNDAELYSLEDVPKILQILEILGFYNTFAIEK